MSSRSHPTPTTLARSAWSCGSVALFFVALVLAQAAFAIPITVLGRTTLDVHVDTEANGVLVRGALQDDQGESVGDAELSVGIGALPPRVTSTDAEGRFQVSVSAADLALAAPAGGDPSAAVTLPIEVHFGGDVRLGASSVEQDVAIERDLVQLDVAVVPPRAEPGDELGLFVTARIDGADTGPRPAAGLELTASLGEQVRSAITDGRGRASFRHWERPAPGTHSFEVRFRGSPRLEAARVTRTAVVATTATVTFDDASTSGSELIIAGRVRFSDRSTRPRGAVRILSKFGQNAASSTSGVTADTIPVDADGRFGARLDLQTLSLSGGSTAGSELTLVARYEPGADHETAADSAPKRLTLPPVTGLGWWRWILPGLLGLVCIALFWRGAVPRRRRVPPAVNVAPSRMPQRPAAVLPPLVDAIGGVVVDALRREPVARAAVTIDADDGTRLYDGRTDDDGAFIAPRVLVAATLSIGRRGYETRALRLSPGAAGRLGTALVLTPIRARTLEAYRAFLRRLFGSEARFGVASPRELASRITPGRRARGAVNADAASAAVNAATSAFEAVYFGGDERATSAAHDGVVAKLSAAEERLR
ncbi:MAG: carboxypeptidase regulatory-like domain-containing protein [Myxococcales bacterium]|nr:carboxypeptidase regulatory-like domain-containing protein [Myxococcales bacterium]